MCVLDAECNCVYTCLYVLVSVCDVCMLWVARADCKWVFVEFFGGRT